MNKRGGQLNWFKLIKWCVIIVFITLTITTFLLFIAVDPFHASSKIDSLVLNIYKYGNNLKEREEAILYEVSVKVNEALHKNSIELVGITHPLGGVIRDSVSIYSRIIGKFPVGSILVKQVEEISDSPDQKVFGHYVHIIHPMNGYILFDHGLVTLDIKKQLKSQCCSSTSSIKYSSKISLSSYIDGYFQPSPHFSTIPSTIPSTIYNSLESSKYVLKMSRKGNEWTDQWPIGNGKFGAFVGGTIDRELIPLSLAGNYISNGETNENDNFEEMFNAFKISRDLLARLKFNEAEQIIGQMQSKKGVGMFQYLNDISLMYSTTPFRLFTVNDTKADRPGAHETFDPNIRNRANVFHRHLKKVISDPADHHQVHAAESVLDMMNGVVYSDYVAVDGSDKYVHHREWFASAVHNIIAGEAKCVKIHNNFENNWQDSCINLSLLLSRDGDVSVSTEVLIDDKYTDPNFHVFRFSVNLEATKQKESNPVACGLVYCQSSTGSSFVHGKSEEVMKGIVCNNAKIVNYYISVVSNTDDNAMRCFHRVDSAFSHGYLAIKDAHTTHFSSKMSATEVSFADKTNSCENSNVDQKIRGCNSNEKSNVTAKVDPLLLSQLYNYGRYLLLSSAQQHVANLQGLWADGSNAAWSGDYHMNINLQQLYWAADSTGLSEVMQPLVEFLRDLANDGKNTAKNLYKCDGWVSHGFTDKTKSTGLLGAPEWSLCTTCGAWMALHLYEHMLYHSLSGDDSKHYVIDVLLPILKGSVTFFTQYLYQDIHGIYNTGPTTSPENSFEIIDTSKVETNITAVNPPVGGKRHHVPPRPAIRRQISYLTMSSALDISILRQLANAYIHTLQVGILLDSNHTAEFTNDYNLARKLVQMVHHMPGNGVPTIKNGTISEYPYNFGPNTTLVSDERLDIGHRHFSPMQWLYPGLFQPLETKNSESNIDNIYKSSAFFMKQKSLHHGGHTSWSAAWEACIHARLRSKKGSKAAITRLITRYLTDNLLSLHPPLKPIVVQNGDCYTCFTDNLYNRNTSIAHVAVSKNRGLETVDGHKFQLDGNLGYVAAINELTVQSHIPGVYFLLPTGGHISDNGYIKRLQARGDATFSYQWLFDKVKGGKIEFKSPHPWLYGYSPSQSPGFFTFNNITDGPVLIAIGSPNMLYMSSLTGSCANFLNQDRSSNIVSQLPNLYKTNNNFINFELVQFPCTIFLCSEIDEESCRDNLYF